MHIFYNFLCLSFGSVHDADYYEKIKTKSVVLVGSFHYIGALLHVKIPLLVLCFLFHAAGEPELLGKLVTSNRESKIHPASDPGCGWKVDKMENVRTWLNSHPSSDQGVYMSCILARNFIKLLLGFTYYCLQIFPVNFL